MLSWNIITRMNLLHLPFVPHPEWGGGVIALCAVGEEQQAASMIILSKYNLSDSKFNMSIINLSE